MSEAPPPYTPSPVADAPAEVHVFVGVFQGLISEVEVYQNGADAEAAFERFCGVPSLAFAEGRVELNFKYEDSTIYVTPVLGQASGARS